MQTLRIKDFQSSGINDSYLKLTDLDNFFNVYKDKHGNYVFNLNNSLYFDFNEQGMQKYTVTGTMHWPLISYKLYGTTRLAWLLMKLNHITTDKVFEPKKAGDKVLCLSKQQLQSIVDSVNEDYQ